MKENLETITECIKNSDGWIWYREIARRTGLHHKTVSRLINQHLINEIEDVVVKPINMKMIRFKQ